MRAVLPWIIERHALLKMFSGRTSSPRASEVAPSRLMGHHEEEWVVGTLGRPELLSPIRAPAAASPGHNKCRQAPLRRQRVVASLPSADRARGLGL